MITLYKRSSVYWAQSNFGGLRKRWSLRTRDRSVAEALRRQAELAAVTSSALTPIPPIVSQDVFVPKPLRKPPSCPNHPGLAIYHAGLCRNCYYDDSRDGEKLAEDEILILRRQGKLERLMRYGLNLESYEVLLKRQNYCCPICGKPLEDDISIDHDHRTRNVRGLLHGICNIALGTFETKGREWTESALKYLGWRY